MFARCSQPAPKMITTIDNYDLSARNTFAMNVKCGIFMEYTKADDIPFLLSSIRKDIGKMHIGAGSNILFTDDYPGVVLHSAIKGIQILGENMGNVIVRAGAGEIMEDLVKWACDRELWGIENLSGIPGEVGASAVQNAMALKHSSLTTGFLKKLPALGTVAGSGSLDDRVAITAWRTSLGDRDDSSHPSNFFCNAG